jgi:hypothetical protein
MDCKNQFERSGCRDSRKKEIEGKREGREKAIGGERK